jgi:hypothetical protein
VDPEVRSKAAEVLAKQKWWEAEWFQKQQEEGGKLGGQTQVGREIKPSNEADDDRSEDDEDKGHDGQDATKR